MQYMNRVLSDSEIPDNAGVAIEFKIPHTSRRVDFLISGKREEKNSIVVEVIRKYGGWESVDTNGKQQLEAGIMVSDARSVPIKRF